jgi:hypothetical protein
MFENTSTRNYPTRDPTLPKAIYVIAEYTHSDAISFVILCLE